MSSDRSYPTIIRKAQIKDGDEWITFDVKEIPIGEWIYDHYSYPSAPYTNNVAREFREMWVYDSSPTTKIEADKE